MNHIRPVTSHHPAMAQFEPVVIFVGLLSSILDLIAKLDSVLELNIGAKDGGMG